MLAKSGGLSPHAQRLLNDVFQAASRVVVGKYEQRQGTAVQPALLLGSGADKMPGKITTQQLRFSWPPAEPGVALGVDASTSRALRGFLGRHLQGKSNAFLLYTSSELGALLDGLELAVETDRVLFIGEPEELLGNGAAKRALWQTLNAL